jgi:hypothetical protein
MAEVTINSKFGHAMFRTIRTYSLRKILEIGSFDGDGSTQVLVAALKGLKNPELTCLEMRTDRFANLLKNTSPYSWVRAVNASSLSWESFTGKDFDSDVLPHLAGHAEPDPEVIRTWWEDDRRLMQSCSEGFLETHADSYDAVLIDGGEFTGYDEFRLLKERTDCFLLDDVFRAYKCKKAFEELSNDREWTAVYVDEVERHGTAIFMRISRQGNSLAHLLRRIRGSWDLFKLLVVEKLRRDNGIIAPIQP